MAKVEKQISNNVITRAILCTSISQLVARLGKMDTHATVNRSTEHRPDRFHLTNTDALALASRHKRCLTHRGLTNRRFANWSLADLSLLVARLLTREVGGGGGGH